MRTYCDQFFISKKTTMAIAAKLELKRAGAQKNEWLIQRLTVFAIFFFAQLSVFELFGSYLSSCTYRKSILEQTKSIEEDYVQLLKKHHPLFKKTTKPSWGLEKYR